MIQKIIITDDILKLGTSRNGKLSDKQLEILKVKKPLVKGWRDDLIGTSFPRSIVLGFIQLGIKKKKRVSKKKIVCKSKNKSRLIKVNHKIPFKDQYYHHNWKVIRLRVLTRDGFKCTNCNSEKNLHVHHKKYIANKFIWEVPMKFLTTLCSTCHKQIHNIP